MSWIALGLMGGVIGLDATSFPQAMWSRPLVAGTLAGLVFGRPASGLLVGAVLEVFALLILPFGAARYPESGTAAAAAATAYALTATVAVDVRLLLLAVVFGLTWEQIAGASVIFVRRLNGRLVALPPAGGYSAAQVTRLHLLALFIDFLRGAWAVVLGSVLGIVLLRAFATLPAVAVGIDTGVLIVATAAMLGAGLTLFGGWRQRWTSLGLGLLCGLLLLLLR